MPIRTASGQRKSIWLAGLSAAALIAGAASAAPSLTLHLPAGPLDQALLALAAQSHQQLLFTRDLTAGRRVPALDGAFTPEAALQRLLAGTGLAARQAGDGVYVLRPVGPAPAGGLQPAVETGPATRPFGAEPADSDIPLPRRASSAEPAPDASGAPTVSALEVTGSHIRGGAPAAPLIVLDRADLDRSGRATVAELLEALPQNFGGVATEGTANLGSDPLARNAAYASSVNLRGLGPDATLVLVDGHRLAGSGSFGDFADVSAIPTAAVARVEVLLDGASALYGSDAVGGVVNIILRKDFRGAETRAYAGAATAGTPLQRQLSQTLGARWTGGGLLASYEFQERTALTADDRAFAASADLRPFGGHDWRPNNAFPGNITVTDPLTGAITVGWAIPPGQTGVGLKPGDFLAGQANRSNSREGLDLLPHQRLHAVYLAADQALGDRLTLAADLRLSRRHFAVHGQVPISTLTATRANPFFASPTGGATTAVSYSFLGQLPNPEASGVAESLGTTLSAQLRLPGDWRADGYLAYARERETARTEGILNSSAVSEALGSVADRPETAFSTARDGFLNPFAGVLGANSPALLAYIAEGFTQSRTEDAVRSANLKADGSLLHLPGGAVKLAVGLQARRESFHRRGINFFSTVTPAAQQPSDARRAAEAAFLELRVPLFGPGNARPGLQRLELSLAARAERYDDAGSTRNPQAGVLWRPMGGVSVRATYGTSFRAPALRELHDKATNSPSQLNLGTARIRVLQLGGGNPDLKPETATTWTAGVDLTPPALPGLRLGATWFDVRFQDRIDRPVIANFSNALTDPTLAPFVERISPATNAADLARITALLASPDTSTAQGVFPPEAYGAIVQTRYVNTTGLHVAGLDLNGRWTTRLGKDALTFGGEVSYLLRYETQFTPTAGPVDRVNQVNFPVRLRSRLTADLTHGPATLGATLNLTGAYKDAQGAHLRAQPTLDLTLGLGAPDAGPWRGVSATLSVRNVFDRAPPFYDNPLGFGYDPANADPVGRFVALQLTRRW